MARVSGSLCVWDDEYYQFLLDGIVVIDGISILDTGHIIPFKIKAFLDLSARKAKGEQVDSKNIRKHRNDVIRLSVLLTKDTQIAVSNEVYGDIITFLYEMKSTVIDVKQLGIRNQSQAEVLEKIESAYIKV